MLYKLCKQVVVGQKYRVPPQKKLVAKGKMFPKPAVLLRVFFFLTHGQVATQKNLEPIQMTFQHWQGFLRLVAPDGRILLDSDDAVAKAGLKDGDTWKMLLWVESKYFAKEGKLV